MEYPDNEEDIEKRIKEIEEELLPALMESYTEKLHDFLGAGLFPSVAQSNAVNEAQTKYFDAKNELSELKNILSYLQENDTSQESDTIMLDIDDLNDLALLEG